MFIASCYSQSHAELFFKAGILHVIYSVRTIDNRTQQLFTDVFYRSVLAKGSRVCEAYHKAIDVIKCHNDPTIRKDWPFYGMFSRC